MWHVSFRTVAAVILLVAAALALQPAAANSGNCKGGYGCPGR